MVSYFQLYIGLLGGKTLLGVVSLLVDTHVGILIANIVQISYSDVFVSDSLINKWMVKWTSVIVDILFLTQQDQPT